MASKLGQLFAPPLQRPHVMPMAAQNPARLAPGQQRLPFAPPGVSGAPAQRVLDAPEMQQRVAGMLARKQGM